jgi:uncharacterized SAM-binding protein YcdF (DUF218 family)
MGGNPMNLGLMTTRLLESVLLPPLSLLLLLAFGIWLARRRRRFGLALAGLAWVALLALSLPAVSTRLKLTLEGHPLDPAQAAGGQAIVVLGGGVRAGAPEFGGDVVNAVTLERLRYGAFLQRRLNKPILVAGGNPTGQSLPEGIAMKQALASDFGVEARWMETTSNTTYENARNAYAILVPLGIDRVLLVTQGWHMPRSRLAFEQVGFKVIEAPTGLTGDPASGPLAWIPSPNAFAESGVALREWLGLIWYRLQSALR